VHVLSHGEVGDTTGKLYVIGTDGARHDLADVEGWLTAVQDGPHRPLVLFVLDICEAGVAARLPWQGATADGTARAWVIAACGPYQQAFNGWLTQATTTVLRRLSAGALDIDPGVEFVPLQKIGQEIRAEVRRLAESAGGLSQQVTGTQLDLTVVPPELPFFRNPAYSSDLLVLLRGREDPALASFADGIDEPVAWGSAAIRTGESAKTVDPAALGGGLASLRGDADLGVEHWVDRSRGHGLIQAAPDAGCFSGRAKQLKALSRWMQGIYREYGAAPRALSVVTGGPGVGKSAVLGLLVCAAHPKLRSATSPLWLHTDAEPGLIPELVAVHARQRDLSGITACLARQLNSVFTPSAAGIPANDAAPSEPDAPGDVPLDPAGLVAAVTVGTAPRAPVPVIVLDALDEAIGPQEIVDQLIVPLASARRVDGGPACLVLVGSRRDGFERLIDAAKAQGGLIDLDETDPDDPDALLHDLGGYMTKLLKTQPGYRDKASACAAFGFAVATALTAASDQDRRWGEFLVAGLYTNSVLRATADTPMRDVAEADRRGAACPRTLPAVLDLDLEARPNAKELRQVLQIVALARGDGIPASIIDRCRPGRPRFGPYTPTLRALSELGFYLRRANDEDGTTLYRVFHEGLADQVRPPDDEAQDDEEVLLRAALSAWEPAWSRRSAEEALVNAMLGSLGDPVARRWDLAEPYVQRHIVDHALTACGAYHADADADADAGTGQPDLSTLLRDTEFLVHADPSLSVVLERLETDEAERISPLLTDADATMATQIATVMEAASAAPQRAAAPADAVVLPLVSLRRAALALAAARSGDPALATALAKPPPGSPESPLPWCPRWTSGYHLSERDMTDAWRADNGAVLSPLGRLQPGHSERVYDVACSLLPDGTPVAVTAGRDETVRVWDLSTLSQIGPPLIGHHGAVRHVASAALPDGTPIAVTEDAHAVFRIWDIGTRRELGSFSCQADRLATARLPDGTPVAILREGARLGIWDLVTVTELGDPLRPWASPISHYACVRSPEGTLTLVVASDFDPPGVVSVMDLATRREIGRLEGHVRIFGGLAGTTLPDGTAVAIADGDDVFRIWDIPTGRQLGETASPGARPLDIACTQLADGTPVGIVATKRRTHVWDLITLRRLDGPDRGSGAPYIACGQRPDGSTVVVTCPESAEAPTPTVWRLPAHPGGPFWPIEGRHPSALSAGVVNGEQVVVVGTASGWIDIGSAADGRLSSRFEASGVVRAVGISQGTAVVSVADEGTVRTTDIQTGLQVGPVRKLDDCDVVAIETASLARRLTAAVTGADNAITLIDLGSGRKLDRIPPDETAIALAADGQVFQLVRRADYTVLVTGPDGQSRGVLAGHTRRISTLTTTSLDGRPVALTASFDGTVRFWDVPTLREIERLDLPGPVQTVTPAGPDHLAVLCSGEVIVYARSQSARRATA
jgi:WD40 repeat protein